MSPKLSSIQAQTAALLLALSLFSPAISHAGPRDVTETSRGDVPHIAIDNFGRVNPNYYRGAEPDKDDYERLAALGIKMLIDLRGDDGDPNEKLLVERAGMNYVRMPMSTHETPSVPRIQEFLRLVNDPVNQPVYVHCVGGRHRTGVMTAVYRMTHDGWTADQAFKEMKEYKFGADFLHSEFKKFVYKYQPDLSLAGKAAQ